MGIPAEATSGLDVLRAVLADELVAVCLYGSAVAAGLTPLSDVDLLAIVDRPVTPETARRLVGALMAVSGRYPPPPGGPRPIEVTILLRDDLAAAAFPVRRQFQYGEWLRADFERGLVPEPVVDPDTTLLIAQARATAVALHGAEPAAVLPAVGPGDIRLAMAAAMPHLLDGLVGDEANVLLTLCRMWRTAETGDFVGKAAAADWAARRASAETAKAVARARDLHLGRPAPDAALASMAARAAADLRARIHAAL